MRVKVLQLSQNEQIMKKNLPPTPKFFGICLTKKNYIEKSNVRNRLKRVLAKFEAERSQARGVNDRSKFREKSWLGFSRSRIVIDGYKIDTAR